MHFEVPKAKSIREFAGEYVMIVISIATALALEHTVQTVHHHRLAEEAAHSMQQELRATVAELDVSVQDNQKEIERLSKLRKALQDDIEQKLPERQTMEHMKQMSNHKLDINLHLPSVKHEAWDVAVASQAASWMAPAELQRYSSAYAAIHDSKQLVETGVNFMAGTQFTKALSDLQISAVSPRDMHYILTSLLISHRQVNSSIVDLRASLLKALPPQEAKRS
jgi:hypothetical protein